MRLPPLAQPSALVILLALVAALVVAQPPAAQAVTPRELDLMAAVNEARAELGLRPLALSQRLRSDAEAYAGTLLASGRFVHAYLRPGTGELLAWGSLGTMGARQIVRRWLASPEHNALLLMPRARRIGVGIVLGLLDEERVRVAVLRIAL